MKCNQEGIPLADKITIKECNKMLDLKKGDQVILKGFTGVKLGVFPVDSVTKKTVTVLKRNGDEMIFDRKTGKQVNVVEGKERYANSIIEDDGSYVAPSTKGAAKKAAKANTKKAKPEPEDDEEDDEEEETPKKSKKVAKKSAKKAVPVEEDEDEDEEDEDDEEPAPVKKSSKKPAKKAAKKPVEEDDDDEDDDEFEEVDD